MDIEQEKMKLFSELKEVREYIKKLERSINDADSDLLENLEMQNLHTSEKIQRCGDESDIIFIKQRMKKLTSWLRYNFDEKQELPGEKLPSGKYY